MRKNYQTKERKSNRKFTFRLEPACEGGLEQLGDGGHTEA